MLTLLQEKKRTSLIDRFAIISSTSKQLITQLHDLHKEILQLEKDASDGTFESSDLEEVEELKKIVVDTLTTAGVDLSDSTDPSAK